MRFVFSSILVLLLAAALAAQSTRPNAPNSTPPASATEAMYRAAAASATAKLEHVEQNAERPTPNPAPTVFTDREINAYLASGEVKKPKGVRSLVVSGEPGVVTARATIDFDAITAGARSPNPLLSLFSGVHDVDASAHAAGAGGRGQVHIDSVAIDGITVPRMALELFVDHYVRPRYPNVGIDSTFKLPERIDTATVGRHEVTVTQK